MNKFLIALLVCFTRGIFSWTSIVITNFKVVFPETSKLLELDVFDDIITDMLLGEVFLTFHTPPPYQLDSNYYCNITKVNETEYQRVCTGGTDMCNQYNKSLNLLSGQKASIFTYEYKNAIITEAYWSTFPMKYIWRIQCTNYTFGSKYCPVSDAKLSVYLQDELQVASLHEIAEDLYDATFITFGDEKGLQWNVFKLSGTPCYHPMMT